MSMYSEATLRKLIEGAKKLGFQDDVDHFTEELNKLLAQKDTNG